MLPNLAEDFKEWLAARHMMLFKMGEQAGFPIYMATPTADHPALAGEAGMHDGQPYGAEGYCTRSHNERGEHTS